MKMAIPLLIVEDEALIMEFVSTELREGGFEVVSAYDGNQALAHLEADASKYRALISDVNLGPGPTGWQVAHRARELAPDIPVVYITAGNADEWSANGVPKSVLLHKPFAASQVLTAISTLLNNSSGSVTG
ncbi:MAG: response regulator [Beijerinckiaceae bacterium]|nr:response regulator [Beijerinckiaceae bacterium]